jgi:hypothetical protein
MSQEHCAGHFNGNVIWENIIKPIVQNDSLREINNDNRYVNSATLNTLIHKGQIFPH